MSRKRSDYSAFAGNRAALGKSRRPYFRPLTRNQSEYVEDAAVSLSRACYLGRLQGSCPFALRAPIVHPDHGLCVPLCAAPPRSGRSIRHLLCDADCSQTPHRFPRCGYATFHLSDTSPRPHEACSEHTPTLEIGPPRERTRRNSPESTSIRLR